MHDHINVFMRKFVLLFEKIFKIVIQYPKIMRNIDKVYEKHKYYKQQSKEGL